MRLIAFVRRSVLFTMLMMACKKEPMQPAAPVPCAVMPGIVLSPPMARVAVGETIRMSASQGEADCGVPLDLSKTSLRWSVADSTIVLVDTISGLVTGRTVGTTTVRATAGGVTGASTVSVGLR